MSDLARQRAARLTILDEAWKNKPGACQMFFEAEARYRAPSDSPTKRSLSLIWKGNFYEYSIF
jgi:hypothetical protein